MQKYISVSTNKLVNDLSKAGNPADAIFLQRYFKTGSGEYGEGDKFLGVRVPKARAIAKKYYKDIDLNDLDLLLKSNWHEVRLAALIAMVMQYKKGLPEYQKQLYNLYLKHIGKGINNWDLVDLSCHAIMGHYLFNKNRAPLYRLADEELWQKRVAIISTFYFLKQGDPTDTYKLAEKLIYEKHDLLQKAVGWSLREVGKLDSQMLKSFLDKYAATMPRTALRYSLEKLSLAEKRYYMHLANEIKN